MVQIDGDPRIIPKYCDQKSTVRNEIGGKLNCDWPRNVRPLVTAVRSWLVAKLASGCNPSENNEVLSTSRARNIVILHVMSSHTLSVVVSRVV